MRFFASFHAPVFHPVVESIPSQPVAPRAQVSPQDYLFQTPWLKHQRRWGTISLSMDVFLDILITSSIVYYLRLAKSDSPFTKTNTYAASSSLGRQAN